MPPISEYQRYVNKIFKSKQLTNQGCLLKELEQTLSNHLNVNHFHYVTNGTILFYCS